MDSKKCIDDAQEMSYSKLYVMFCYNLNNDLVFVFLDRNFSIVVNPEIIFNLVKWNKSDMVQLKNVINYIQTDCLFDVKITGVCFSLII